MFGRGTRYLVVSLCVLGLAQTTYGVAIFSGSISMSDTDLGDLNNVAQGAGITLDVAATVTYLGSNPGDDINGINLNFSDSTQDLSGASWAWDSDTDGITGLTNESGMADEIVTRAGDDTPITATAFDLGILTFNAPSTNGTYTVYLTGGTGSDVTYMADEDEFLGVAGGNLTLETFTFTVIPEPTTMAVLGCGGLLALLRRKRRG